MALNKSERRVIEATIAKLDPENSGFFGSPAIKIAFGADEAVGRYLQSWVLPALKILIKEDRTKYDLYCAVQASD